MVCFCYRRAKVVKVWVESKKYLFVKYSDGTIKKVDLFWLLEGMGSQAKEVLKDNMIEKVFVENSMPTWSNGFDLDHDLADNADATQDIASSINS